MPTPTKNRANLFCLFIAINEYHPKSDVGSLSGCINDLEAMQAFVLSKFKYMNPQILTLVNQEATRKKIIKSFRKHLSAQAKAGDQVLFYFSGHGSHTKTASVFSEFDGFQQDETFVCYDSRRKGRYDLTDKEMAVLLSEIEEGVNTVVIADSCHSASVTRGENNLNEKANPSHFLTKRRYIPSSDIERPIESYLLSKNNFYAQLDGEIKIPRSKHLLFSACDRSEEAWETIEKRGLFTTSLLKVLNQNSNLSYSEIFARVRTLVNRKTTKQNPTFFPQEGFNPHQVFFKKETYSHSKRHAIYQKGKQWYLDYGAINGLPTHPENLKKLVLGIYEEAEGSAKFIGQSTVSKVLLKTAKLNDTALLREDKSYFGELFAFPNALIVSLEGEAVMKKSFWKIYKSIVQPSAFVQFEEDVEGAKYSLNLTKDVWGIYLKDGEQLVHGIQNQDKNGLLYLLEVLEKIENWERLHQLQNEATKYNPEDVAIQFVLDDEKEPFEEAIITLDYPEKGKDKDKDGDPIGLFYKIKLKNNTAKDIFVALFQMGINYEIANHYVCGKITPSDKWITLDDEHGLAILDENLNETTDTFKIIISKEPFDDYKFIQTGFDLGKVKSKGELIPMKSTIKRKTDKGDWFVKTITVNTVRKQSEIGPQTIQMPGISILSHPDFKADLSLTAMGGNTRSLRLGGQLNQRIDGEEAQILNFAGTRSTLQNQSIFELSGMEKPESLKEHPLKIKIDAEVANGAAVFPVTLKEDFIIPFGTPLLQEDGSVLLEIDELPKDTDLLPTKPGTRSPGRAIWFSLLKMAGLEERVFLLRKVVYNDGIGARVALGEEDIKNANRILLITHGIIGDTKTMIKNLEFLLTEKHYDLLICFDYENLNTPIESIAEKLDEALKEVGIDENHQKTFHILCHSMGGLVSRYLIEHLHSGEDLVEHLFMFGTPNGGSVFGEIPAFRDRLIQLLTVALNFSKGWSPWVATALGLTNKVLVGSKPLTKTLAQMSGKSKFIKGLKKTGPISTQYSIIAGDISAYKSIKDKRLARLIEMVLLKIGDLANGEPNDIAVKVKDIRRIPKNIESYKSNICCHHLNYFDSEEGVNKLKQVISKK